MDIPDHTLAGDLSRPVPKLAIDYIGWFSRFESKTNHTEIYEKLFVVSGPEPYGEQFFNEILDFCKDKDEKMACLIPVDYPLTVHLPENLELVVAKSWQENDHLFHQSKTIVSRAGYSTLMDLKILKKNAVLIPTPGQAEQIYLSKLHQDNAEWKFCETLRNLE